MRKVLLTLLCLVVPGTAQTVEVEGKKFDKTATIEGKTLKLIGAGLALAPRVSRQCWDNP